jgi:hypothetical protein
MALNQLHFFGLGKVDQDHPMKGDICLIAILAKKQFVISQVAC